MLYSPKTAEGIFQVLLNTKGGCFTIWKSSPPFSRLPIGMRTSYALLFNNAHFRQRLRRFLLIYTARRRAVGTKEHCFAKNGGACGRGFFAHFVFHFFLLGLVFLCTFCVPAIWNHRLQLTVYMDSSKFLH